MRDEFALALGEVECLIGAGGGESVGRIAHPPEVDNMSFGDRPSGYRRGSMVAAVLATVLFAVSLTTDGSILSHNVFPHHTLQFHIGTGSVNYITPLFEKIQRWITVTRSGLALTSSQSATSVTEVAPR